MRRYGAALLALLLCCTLSGCAWAEPLLGLIGRTGLADTIEEVLEEESETSASEPELSTPEEPQESDDGEVAVTPTEETADVGTDTGLEPEEPPPMVDTTANSALDEDGSYDSRDDVALYLVTYRHLPGNYITKGEARALGWSGGSLEPYAPGKCIGGDRFGNREGILPQGGTYTECDIDTLGQSSRGAKRIVYDENFSVYYTDDHYASFTQLYGEGAA